MHRHLRPLARRVWVPLALAVLVVAGVLVALPWYYKEYRGATPDRGLTDSELGWAASYAPWRASVGATIVRAYEHRSSVDGELGLVLEELADCADDLRTNVGPPASERLVPVAERAALVCAGAERALAEYRAADDTPSWRTSRSLAGAADSLRGSEVALRRLMLAQRPLERLDGPQQESRIEPRLSDGVSVDDPSEVVCWSTEEWPQVQAELAAIGLEQDPRHRRNVNAYRFRVHASPDVCQPLVRLAYAGDSGARAQPEPELVQALVAMLHAARHAAGGVEDEREAECEAVRRIARTAAALGADDATARRLEALARDSSSCTP